MHYCPSTLPAGSRAETDSRAPALLVLVDSLPNQLTGLVLFFKGSNSSSIQIDFVFADFKLCGG